MRRFAVAAFAVLVTAAFAAAASAAAPRLILVDQGGLKRPIVLANWDENGSLLSDSNQGRPVRKAALRNRPSFRLSFMWGPEWEDYVAQGQPLAALRSSWTEFHGRFWPAVGAKPAVIDLGHGVVRGARIATQIQLRIMRKAPRPNSRSLAPSAETALVARPDAAATIAACAIRSSCSTSTAR
jgi:hypothetical protein